MCKNRLAKVLRIELVLCVKFVFMSIAFNNFFFLTFKSAKATEGLGFVVNPRKFDVM